METRYAKTMFKTCQCNEPAIIKSIKHDNICMVCLGYVTGEKKPPLGLMPREIHDMNRGLEILDAMKRYIESDKTIPKEWFEELQYSHGEPNADL